tara:strand:- start:827 stop:1183 length:357 start_codon:yes stop_codon:yes gene_type:complete
MLALASANALAEPFTLPESPLPDHVDRILSIGPALELRPAREQTEWTFEDAAPAGFERKRLQAGMKVHGWRVKQFPNLYVGQAHVGCKWGLGLVMEHGKMAFGMNHRGIELRKSLKSL